MGSEGEPADTKVGAREIIIVDLPKLPNAGIFFLTFFFNVVVSILNLTISFISEDLVIECVAVSYVLPQGDNDMYDDMPELEDYVDVVADLLMVNLPQNQGSLHGHGFLLQSAASC